MKNLLVLFTVAMLMGTMGCENTDSINHEKKITYLKTELGGCHNEDFDDLKSTHQDFLDTVRFTIINQDTLNVFVGLNYICCAPFDDETAIINDTLIMTLNDSCADPYHSCYCRCNCYYTWDFQYVDFEKKKYNFLVMLNDPRVEHAIVFKQGIVDLSE